MNAIDVMKYGHQTIVDAVKDLPEIDWRRGGACGHWSTKEIIAHLASFERALVELLQKMLAEDNDTPTLDRFINNYERFNDDEVLRRSHMGVAEVWAEYSGAYRMALALMAQIPEETRRAAGTLPWYGEEYSLEDFLVYAFYGHKREHGAQIMAFRDRLHQFEPSWGVYA